MATSEMDYMNRGGGTGNVLPYVTDNGHFSTYTIDLAFNNDDATWWISEGSSPSLGGYIYADYGELVSLKKAIVRTGNYGNSDVTNTINIYGADENNQNKTLIATTTAKYSDGRKEIALTGSYRYYYFEAIGTSAAFGSFSHLSAYN